MFLKVLSKTRTFIELFLQLFYSTNKEHIYDNLLFTLCVAGW